MNQNGFPVDYTLFKENCDPKVTTLCVLYVSLRRRLGPTRVSILQRYRNQKKKISACVFDVHRKYF